MTRLESLLVSILMGNWPGVLRRFGGLAWAALLVCWASGAGAGDWQSDWDLPDGFSLKIDVEGFDAPTAIAFVPQPGLDAKSPLYFVTELPATLCLATDTALPRSVLVC